VKEISKAKFSRSGSGCFAEDVYTAFAMDEDGLILHPEYLSVGTTEK
jgi:hypothetical protein